jgi:hypothetical protein
MIIADGDAVAGYEIADYRVVEVVGLGKIRFEMVQRGYAKELRPLAATPVRPGSSHDVAAACSDDMMWE